MRVSRCLACRRSAASATTAAARLLRQSSLPCHACRHTFCLGCIKSVLQTARSQRCPLCNATVPYGEAFALLPA